MFLIIHLQTADYFDCVVIPEATQPLPTTRRKPHPGGSEMPSMAFHGRGKSPLLPLSSTELFAGSQRGQRDLLSRPSHDRDVMCERHMDVLEASRRSWPFDLFSCLKQPPLGILGTRNKKRAFRLLFKRLIRQIRPDGGRSPRRPVAPAGFRYLPSRCRRR